MRREVVMEKIVMRALIFALALIVLVLAFGSSLKSCRVCAAVGDPFLKGLSNPEELADKVRVSLVRNPKGTSVIDPVRCKRDGSCATPENYLRMFQESDPGAGLTTVAQVPTYLRNLEVADAPAGEYWLSCLKPSSRGIYEPVLHCLSRSFKPGEKAWIDPKTRRIVLASDCTNPVEKPVPPKNACVEIHFFTKSQDTAVRFALLGPADVDNDCIGVKRAGEEDFENLWAKECESTHCDFSADVAVVGQSVRLMGSYAPVPGEHVLRLPALVAEKSSKYTTVLCLERGAMAWPELPKDQTSFAQSYEYGERREEWDRPAIRTALVSDGLII